MARTPNATIIEWGTPPEPVPTGWDAIAAELDARPGEWANVGLATPTTARKIQNERLPESAGYEHRVTPTADPSRLSVWVRRRPDDGTPAEPAKGKRVARGSLATPKDTPTE